MVIVDYIKESEAFIRTASYESYTANERILWHVLLHFFNERGQGNLWPDEHIPLPNRLLLSMVPFGQDVLDRARNQLVQHGRIDYVKGKKGSDAPKYKMIYFHATPIPNENRHEIHISIDTPDSFPTQNTINREINRCTAVNPAVNPAVSSAVNPAVNPAVMNIYTKTDSTKTKTKTVTVYSPYSKESEEEYTVITSSMPARQKIAIMAAVRHSNQLAAHADALSEYLDNVTDPPELVEYAVHKAIRHREPLTDPIAYIDSLLNDYASKGFQTVEDLETSLSGCTYDW